LLKNQGVSALDQEPQEKAPEDKEHRQYPCKKDKRIPHEQIGCKPGIQIEQDG
jgi:hypothetical protein